MPDNPDQTPSARSAAAETGQLQTLHRALDVLESLAHGGEAGLSDISARLGLARTTIHRLLTTLTARGFVRQDGITRRYRVGIRSFEVGSAFSSQNQVKDLARPVLRELNQQFNETITLAMLDGGEAVYLDLVESNQTLRTFARVGVRVPLHCTGVGKALLMGFSASDLAHFVRQPLPGYTPSTLTSSETLTAEVKRALEVGYILDREEYHLGVRCGAAPIRDHSGQVTAALSVSGPSYRFNDKLWLTAARSVAAAAQELSRQLGYNPAGSTKRVTRSKT